MMQRAMNQAATRESLSRLRLTACTIDLTRREVIREGTVVRLTSLESNLLTQRAQRHEEVVSREERLRSVWGYHPGVVSRAADNTIRRLRRKIEQSA